MLLPYKGTSRLLLPSFPPLSTARRFAKQCGPLHRQISRLAFASIVVTTIYAPLEIAIEMHLSNLCCRTFGQG